VKKIEGDAARSYMQLYKMPLTINLYREDEVLSSLRYSVLKGNGREAVFWAQEALDSGLREAVLESLFWVWVFGAAAANPGWLVTYKALVQKNADAEDEDIMTAVMTLTRKLRDGTVVAILGLGLHEENVLAERVGAVAIPDDVSDLGGTYAAAGRACRQGKAALAWSLLRPLWATDESKCWNLLQTMTKRPEIIELLQTCIRSPLWVWPCRAAAVAIACFSKAAAADTWTIPIEWASYKYEWMDSPMQFRRIHVPIRKSLYWFTARGSLRTNETTDRDLTYGLTAELMSSHFWKPIYGAIRSDDDREAFYDTYFMTDIPDEWPQECREVSHGFGVVPTLDPVNYDLIFQHCLDNWFGDLPCLLWQGLPLGLSILRKSYAMHDGRPTPMLEGIAAAYNGLGAPAEPYLCTPVRRQIEVV